MKRHRPAQHRRRLKSGKVILVNRGVKRRRFRKGNLARVVKNIDYKGKSTYTLIRPGMAEFSVETYTNPRLATILRDSYNKHIMGEQKG